MPKEDKLRLLKSLYLLRRIPDDQLRKLSEFLTFVEYKDGATIFQEGSPGDALYFVSSGHVRIAKRLEPANPSAGHKELALLGAGHCFGEMALIEAEARSADAFAQGGAV